jgi:hypothetical protein
VAVMLELPTLNVEVENTHWARPELFGVSRVHVPSRVEPLKMLTVPPTGSCVLPCTLAVKVTELLVVDGFEDEVSVVVVDARLTESLVLPVPA